MLDFLTSMIMPLCLCFVSVFFITGGKKSVTLFTQGAEQGIKCCVSLLPTFALVICGVNAMFASGFTDLLCNLLQPLFLRIGVPKEMLPSVILRPFSGSAVTAVADRMFRENGADSLVSKTASLLMGSTDTIIYTLGVYFSAANVKKTRYAMSASFLIFIISVLVCCSVGRIMYG